jgi:hypothetical protein
MKPGLLLVWTDIPADLESDFNEWYTREHMPDRILKVPGFVRGRRYAAVDASLRYATIYDLSDTDVMHSPAHMTLRRSRTARDLQFVPHFRNTIKGVCDVVADAGVGEGGGIVMMPFTAQPADRERFIAWASEALIPALAATRGIVSARLGVRNGEAQSESSKSNDRQGDRFLEMLVVADTVSEEGAANAIRMLSAGDVSRAGGAPHLVERPMALRLVSAFAAR